MNNIKILKNNTGLELKSNKLDPFTNSIIEELIYLHSKLKILKRLNKLAPNTESNSAFSKLVELVISNKKSIQNNLAISDPRILKIKTSMQKIASEGEYLLEKHYANKIISQKFKLSDFPYYQNYKRLTQIESKYIGKRNTLFIGSGPLPLSAYLYTEKAIPVSVLDINKKAITLSKKFFKHISTEKNKQRGADSKILLDTSIDHIFGDIHKFNSINNYSCIFLGALVGSSPQEKHKILKKIIDSAKPGTRIITRTVEGLAELLYPSVKVPNSSKIKKIKYVPVPRDIINPIIIIDIK